MNAPLPNEIEATVDSLVAFLADAEARRQIADAWLTGWVPAEMAMRALIDLGLIEFTPEARQ